jgi:hypothetical protein
MPRLTQNNQHAIFIKRIMSESIANSSRILLIILLLPFTFHPFAAPGYFASCQSFFLPASTQVPPAPKPPWINHFLASRPNCSIPHPGAFITFKLACLSSAPHHLLSRANKIWLPNHPDDKFGITYLTTAPSQWATQLLHLSRRYAQHVSTSITTILNCNQYHGTCHISPLSHPHVFLINTYRFISAILNFAPQKTPLPFSHNPPHS